MSTVWALGDYHRFATTLIWHFGAELVADTGIERGMRVLDVAAGTGNVALRAAQRGALVTAVDLEPAQLERGRAEGPVIEWVQADARELPFADGAFDVVTSAAGAIFAGDHQQVAHELMRVTRPGGTIGMINFTPGGLAGEFFSLFARYLPPGPAPTDWGSEPIVTRLFAGCALDLERRSYVENPPGGFAAFYKATFGPAVAIDDPAFDRELRAFAAGAGELRFEYLRVLATRVRSSR
jgi:2-polyprenyl-6-hydroxyphenyl methylase/3-demethylubiquinone-9 3-methyltransferase